MNHKTVLTTSEAASMSGLSRMTITRMFEREPGVIVIRRAETLHKRQYRTIRIPRAVYERVIRKVTN